MMYLVVMELFPTSVRASSYAVPLMVGKGIGIISPYYGALQHENKAMFFPIQTAMIAVCIILMVAFVPETGLLPTPNTMGEAKAQQKYTPLKGIMRCKNSGECTGIKNVCMVNKNVW